MNIKFENGQRANIINKSFLERH